MVVLGYTELLCQLTKAYLVILLATQQIMSATLHIVSAAPLIELVTLYSVNHTKHHASKTAHPSPRIYTRRNILPLVTFELHQMTSKYGWSMDIAQPIIQVSSME